MYGFDNSKEKNELELKYTAREFTDGDFVRAVWEDTTGTDSLDLEYHDTNDRELENDNLTPTQRRTFLNGQNMVFVTASIGGGDPVEMTVYGGVPQTGGELSTSWSKFGVIELPLGSGSVTFEMYAKILSNYLMIRLRVIANTSGETSTNGAITLKAGNWAIV